MTRLFCDFPLAIGENIELSKDAARHIMVLRLSAGDPLTLYITDPAEVQQTLIDLGRALKADAIQLKNGDYILVSG